jgi:RimJ/RimL family protein N-acetyltransferase
MGRKFVMAHEDERVAEFVCKHNAMELGDSPYTAIGQGDAMGNVIGGVVFNNFTKTDIHLHVAGVGRYWLSRRFLGECYRYVFMQLKCARNTVLIDAANQHSIDFCEGLGYVFEGTLRRYLANGNDCHVLGMLREECRWLKAGELTNGLKSTPPPTVSRLRQRERTALQQTPAQRRSTGL